MSLLYVYLLTKKSYFNALLLKNKKTKIYSFEQKIVT